MRFEVNIARSYWHDNNLDQYDFILLQPSNDYDSNIRMCSAFECMLCNRRGVVITGEPAQKLLRLYTLYEFSDKLIIGSFDLPPGRKLRNLLDSGAATEDELINDVILGRLNGTIS